MKQILFISFYLFVSIICHAQDSLNFGKVTPDTVFDCKNDNSGDPDFGIGSICNSKNEFELRLQGYSRPNGGSAMIIITWNKQNWDVKKYERRNNSLGKAFISTSYNNNYDRVQKHIFNLVFDTLKNNHVFTLPNQQDLNAKGDIHDGAAYRLTFKVHNNFRSYWFENPESYLENNPGMIELKNYAAIVKILYSLF